MIVAGGAPVAGLYRDTEGSLEASCHRRERVDSELVELERFLSVDSEQKRAQKDVHIVLMSFYSFNAFSVHTLGSVLRSHGFTVSHIFFKNYLSDNMDLPTEAEYDILMNLLEELKPDLVGLSLMSTFAPIAEEVTTRARRFGVPLVWGGAHAINAAEDSITHADVVCIGEGEFALLKLAYALHQNDDYRNIKNLWFRGESKKTKDYLYPLLQDLDLVPYPEFGDAGKYYIEHNTLHRGEPYYTNALSWYNFMSGRGCPFACSFCSNSYLSRLYKGRGPILRRRTVDNVIMELVSAKNRFPELSSISANDEVFVLQKDWLVEFCNQYREKINLPFHCDIHPTRITDDTIALLHSINLKTISVGFQSGSERIRRDVYKRNTPDNKVIQGATILKKYDVFPSYDFIFENPLETKEDLEESLEFLMKLPRPFRLNTYNLQNHPNTDLTSMLLSKGLISEGDIDGVSLKGLKQWHMNLKYHHKQSETFHIYCLFKMCSYSIAIFTPYFYRRYSVYPRWLLRCLINNKETIRRYPTVLRLLLLLGEAGESCGRYLSVLLSGNISKITERVFR
ncbi:MAG: B12-binding domain-containing radical SAM protein [SAR202 cluster bacterium]|jgi:radical SAM superfamily enzyme YgiQ (UPF0313 family)|nr:hypothetical protein [Acidobacteriota bacterium]MQG69201.1 B12-binding domain-containing radical SAM protein [SAR202 cluster bacterium]|tara:strand:- start:286 stop:1986 length:1701 start_codon:yes stop_codon:yes gene_type:complete